MRLAIVGFAAGVWLLQRQAVLPAGEVLAGLAAVAAALTFAARRGRAAWWSAARLLAAGLAGFLWAAACAHWRLADRLPEENEGRDIRLSGVVADLPQPYEGGLRFVFDVEWAEAAVPARLSLAWQAADPEAAGAAPPPRLHAGSRWQLTVRLKRPHGNLNPHGFDYEGWLFERGLRATGYVRAAPDNRLLDAFVWRPAYVVARLREAVRSRFQRLLPPDEQTGVLVALAVGDQRAIDGGLWPLFARTGTTHLMSISGLHVTMVAAFAAALVSLLWRRRPALMLRLPAQKAAAAAGWGAAFLYSLLAGFGVPAQRTLYMLSVVVLALFLGRTTAGTRVLALALFVVLLLDPWAVLATGFWLSFGAVALLFLVSAGRLGAGHWLGEWVRAQWAVTLGLIPALLALFQQFSLVSPFANAVAIPVVSLVVTPLVLAAVVLPLDALLLLAHLILSWLMACLQWLAELPVAVWQQAAPPAWAVGAGLVGVLWLLMPRGFPARWNGVLLLLPLVLVEPSRPVAGELRLTVLDVGQGLAVHLQTARHDLLYDTGPQYSTDANGGNRILLPYLRAVGVGRLDGLILSHEDRDHSGGAISLLDALPVAWTASSLPAGHPFRDTAGHRPCLAGERWEWDGVRFELLHPEAAAYEGKRKSNDMSCVLKVSTSHGSALLTGDIETPSEQALVQRLGERLRAEVLVAPHHGSRTSSAPEFVAAVGADTVIFPVGYRNRFRHPNAAVWRRYEESGARLARTDRDGAVTVEFAVPRRLTFERVERRRYWHGQ